MHYGLPFLDQSGRKWHNKTKSGQKERGKLSRGRQKQRKWETRSKREQGELEETPAGVDILVLDGAFSERKLVGCQSVCM